MGTRRTLTLLAIAIPITAVIGVVLSHVPAPGSSPSQTASPAPSPSRIAITRLADPGQLTGTILGHCTYRTTADAQPLPDRHCTPGGYDPTITAAQLCAPGYSTKTYRPQSSATTRFKYNVAYPAYKLQPAARSELDHLIPLELAGDNDATNLWPEVGTIPNAKDSVENAIKRWLCSTTPTTTRLRQAQLAIAVNWTTAEAKLGAH